MNGGDEAYRYHDHGSWSLEPLSTVGSLMGNLMRGSMMVEGYIARIVYISSTGCTRSPCTASIKTGLIMLVGRINRVLRPSMKLH